MGCCICEAYRWRVSPPMAADYFDGQREYCILHAPVELKVGDGVDTRSFVQSFNETVHEHIEKGVNGGHTSDGSPYCDLSGVVFPGHISFSQWDEAKQLPMTSFNGAEFATSADFHGVYFGDSVDFSNTTFTSKCYFMRTKFLKNAMFNNCKFLKDVNFSNACFNGEVSFNYSEFSKGAYFVASKFELSVDFIEVTFSSSAAFQGVQFKGAAKFISSCFGELARFNSVSIESEMLFRACSVKDQALKMHNLSAISLRNINFSTDDLPGISFRGCDWPTRLGLEEHDKGQNYKGWEEIYRAMKQRAAEEHDQPQVSHWHFREKLTQLKSKLLPDQNALEDLNLVEDDSRPATSRVRSWASLFMRIPWSLRLSLLFWYWSTSGFGERPRRAGWCLAIVIALPLATAVMGQLVGVWPPGPFDGAALSGVITDWQRALPLVKVPAENAPTGWKLLWYNVSQLVITVQAALFGFAVRNRFRR